jgi:hypothetical protein
VRPDRLYTMAGSGPIYILVIFVTSIFVYLEFYQVSISVIGINLGAHDPSAVATVGNTRCLGTYWQSDTLLICRIAQAGRVESTALEFVLKLPSHELRVASAVSYDPLALLLPPPGAVFIKTKTDLTLSSDANTAELLDKFGDAITSALSVLSVSLAREDVYIDLAEAPVARRQDDSALAAPRSLPRRQSGDTRIESWSLASDSDYVKLATGLTSIARDGSLLVALVNANLPISSLALADLAVLDSAGDVVKCCCDRSICGCYVCLESMPEPNGFSLTTAIVAVCVIIAAGIVHDAISAPNDLWRPLYFCAHL